MSEIQAENSVTPDLNNDLNGSIEEKSQENENKQGTKQIEINTAKTLTEAQRLEQRIKKFGAQTENSKKDLRAQRFGVAGSGEKSTQLDKDKLDKRAQRFGAAQNSSTGKPDADVLEKRAKRFGASENTTDPKTDDLLAKRKERFGITDDETKKKLRSQRFENKS